MTVIVPFHTTQGTIDLAALRDQDMTADILAETLAKLPRYNARTRYPWSVAAHSLLVEHLCPPDLKGWALLHDAHEAFLGDLTTPALELFCQHGPEDVVQRAVEGAKARIDNMIARAWSCPNRSHSLGIRQADWLALQVEMSVFFGASLDALGPQERQMAELALGHFHTLPRLSWLEVKAAWITRAQTLAALGLLRLPLHEPALAAFPPKP